LQKKIDGLHRGKTPEGQEKSKGKKKLRKNLDRKRMWCTFTTHMKKRTKMEKKLSFGSFIKEKRILSQITLREFCNRVGIDPSNWSKIERCLAMPPKSRTLLQEIAKTLGLESGTEDYYLMYDLAALSYIPEEFTESNKVLQNLPVFFRTARGDKPTTKELEDLFKLILEG